MNLWASRMISAGWEFKVGQRLLIEVNGFIMEKVVEKVTNHTVKFSGDWSYVHKSEVFIVEVL